MPRGIPVRCIETGETFAKIVDAAKKMGLRPDQVAASCDKGRAFNGYRFERIIAPEKSARDREAQMMERRKAAEENRLRPMHTDSCTVCPALRFYNENVCEQARFANEYHDAIRERDRVRLWECGSRLVELTADTCEGEDPFLSEAVKQLARNVIMILASVEADVTAMCDAIDQKGLDAVLNDLEEMARLDEKIPEPVSILGPQLTFGYQWKMFSAIAPEHKSQLAALESLDKRIRSLQLKSYV